MSGKDFDPLDDWLQTRPKRVQELASEFPIGTILKIKDKNTYLIGWTESDGLIVSPIDPYESYDKSIDQQIYVCAGHFR